MITFGVQQVQRKSQQAKFSNEDFDKLARDLEQRELTGHAARDAIQLLWLRLHKNNGMIGTEEY